MKKVFLITIVFFGILNFSIAQIPIKESDVPEVVKSKLPNLFPGASNVKWTKLTSEYHAAFIYEGTNVEVVISESGRWIKSESEYKIEDCPRAMQKHLNANNPNSRIVKLLLVENKDVSEYDVELLDTLTQQKYFSIYDVSGAYVRKTDSKGVDTELQLTGTNEKGKLAVHPKELPSAINSYIIINYTQYSIRESYIVNNEKYQNAYYIILKKVDDKTPVELWFDYQGTPISGANRIVAANADDNNKGDKKNHKKLNRTPFPQSKVPVVAVDLFSKKEPKAEEVRWDTIGGKYVVSYYNPTRSTDNQMYFDSKGNYIMTSTALNPKNLLPMIQNYLSDNYPTLEMESAENIVDANKKKFTLVKLYSNSWINDPMVYHEIYFSTSGRLEKEVLADYIDGNDEYLREQKERRHEAFQEYLDYEDISLNDDNNLDGQSFILKELPSQTQKFITTNYKGWAFTDGIIITDENQLRYSVFLKKEGYRDRKRLLFDIKGNFLKEEDL